MLLGGRQRNASAVVLLFGTATTLLLALSLGGGPGSRLELLLALPGLLLIAAATYRALATETDTTRLRWLLFLPVALIGPPLLQLIPLPPAVWTVLPGRSDLVADMTAAGVTPGWAALSLDRLATERFLYTTLVPIGVFMAAVVLRSRDRRWLVAAALGFAGLSALLGLWQMMEGAQSRLYFYEITNQGSAVGFFANRNHLASLLVISLPVTVGLMADRLRDVGNGARDLRVWLLTALLVVLAVGVTATGSRAGFALLMLSVLAGALVIWWARLQGASRNTDKWIRVAGVIATLLIVQSTLYALMLRLQVDPMDDYRWAVTPRTLEAAAPTSGIGFGFGTFVQAYDELGDAVADMPSYVNHAHNDYAELWLEGGLAALLLSAAAVSVVLFALYRNFRTVADDADGSSPDRGLGLGATCGLLLLALHSVVDYPLRTQAISTYAALLFSVMVMSMTSPGAFRAGARRRMNGA